MNATPVGTKNKWKKQDIYHENIEKNSFFTP